MAKKTTGPRATTGRSTSTTALVPTSGAAGGQLAKVTGGADASVFRDKDVTLMVGQPYSMGDRSVVADAVYYVGGGPADGRNGRLGEADKIAWRDPATGYECIIMRDGSDGYLSGYVAVPPGHPLYGFDHDAVPPDLDIEVHGGLTYSAICDEGPSPRRLLIKEARTICHVPRDLLSHATDHRVGHDQAWWFGFECNHVYDVVPGARNDRDRFLGHETGATFKDEGYVYGQVVDLAAQLRAIADGAPKPPRTGAPPPPLGLDSKKAG